MFSYMMSHPVRFLKENRDISVTHTLINVIAFACYQIRKKKDSLQAEHLTIIWINRSSVYNEDREYLTHVCVVFVSSGIPTVPGTVTLKKDSQNLIGISIGGGAQFCPCLYIVQVIYITLQVTRSLSRPLTVGMVSIYEYIHVFLEIKSTRSTSDLNNVLHICFLVSAQRKALF